MMRQLKTNQEKKGFHKHHPAHGHHMHHVHASDVSEKTVRWLFLSFIINMMLSLVEIIAGLVAGSIALIGDALHNTSDAFSILIAIIAFKIGRKKADKHYTYGFKRAETIGGFVNLILLFIAGLYLGAEGMMRLFKPEVIEGRVIIWVSVLALLVDAMTAKLSHHGSAHNSNLRMVFLHNLADALGSIGVIISGLCVLWWGVYWVDGFVAILIAAYMIYQSVLSFPKIVRVLMNAAPDGIDMVQIEKTLKSIKGVQDVHHMHVWSVNERDISLECHIVAQRQDVTKHITHVLNEKFGIAHCNIQVEKECVCESCCL